MKKIVTILIVAAVIVAGVYAFRGGSKPLGQGVPAGAEITGIGQILDHGKSWQGREVTVKGEMTEKCPTTGCWFYIKDSTGTIRVDTAPSGFTIAEIPAGKTITVHGKVTVADGGATELVATGVKQ